MMLVWGGGEGGRFANQGARNVLRNRQFKFIILKLGGWRGKLTFQRIHNIVQLKEKNSGNVGACLHSRSHTHTHTHTHTQTQTQTNTHCQMAR